MAHVDTDEFSLRTQIAQFSGQGLARFVAPAGDNHAGAFARKGQGGRTADARQGAGDQHNRGAHVHRSHSYRSPIILRSTPRRIE